METIKDPMTEISKPGPTRYLVLYWTCDRNFGPACSAWPPVYMVSDADIPADSSHPAVMVIDSFVTLHHLCIHGGVNVISITPIPQFTVSKLY
jgi:hypothetical protein